MMKDIKELEAYMMPTDSALRELIHHCLWLVSGEMIHDDLGDYPASEEAIEQIEDWLLKRGYIEDETDIPSPQISRSE